MVDERKWEVLVIMPFEDDWTEAMAREYIVNQLDSGEYLPRCDIKTIRPVEGRAKELLRNHLGPARMEDAIDRLARLIENGELMAATDPVAFLDMVADRLRELEALGNGREK